MNKKNFLTDVVFRLDFQTIESLISNPPEEFIKKISDLYPVTEKKQNININVKDMEIEPSVVKTSRSIFLFKSKDGSKIIEVSAEWLAIIDKSYDRFSNFKKVSEKIIKDFTSIYPINEISRIGLRYINQIRLNEKDYFNWSEYFNKDIISSINFFDDKAKIKRIMQTVEISPDSEHMLRFNHGIFNSVYPSRVINKEYILDYDAYTQLPTKIDKVMDNLEKFHDSIMKLFNLSTTEKFKKLLKL